MPTNWLRVAVTLIGVAAAGGTLVTLAQPPGNGPDNGNTRRRGGNQNNLVEITIQGDYRYIRSNGIPDHDPGQFPNRGNPHTISPQSYTLRVPVRPEKAARPTPVPHNLFGVALNGVVFDPGTAEFWNRDRNSGWNYDALSGKINLGLDQSNAHVQPSGAYHYHGLPRGLIRKLSQENRMTMVGYGADGFPVYAESGYRDANDANSGLINLQPSWQLKEGTRPSGRSGPGGRYDGTFVQDFEYVAGTGDLDECNGRDGVTPEYPEGTYYYVLTDTYPFVPRFYRGEPDSSFLRRGGPGGPGGGPGGPGGGPPGRRPPGPPPFGRPPGF